jgi:hypothetical protein
MLIVDSNYVNVRFKKKICKCQEAYTPTSTEGEVQGVKQGAELREGTGQQGKRGHCQELLWSLETGNAE